MTATMPHCVPPSILLFGRFIDGSLHMPNPAFEVSRLMVSEAKEAIKEFDVCKWLEVTSFGLGGKALSKVDTSEQPLSDISSFAQVSYTAGSQRSDFDMLNFINLLADSNLPLIPKEYRRLQPICPQGKPDQSDPENIKRLLNIGTSMIEGDDFKELCAKLGFDKWYAHTVDQEIRTGVNRIDIHDLNRLTLQGIFDNYLRLPSSKQQSFIEDEQIPPFYPPIETVAEAEQYLIWLEEMVVLISAKQAGKNAMGRIRDSAVDLLSSVVSTDHLQGCHKILLNQLMDLKQQAGKCYCNQQERQGEVTIRYILFKHGIDILDTTDATVQQLIAYFPDKQDKDRQRPFYFSTRLLPDQPRMKFTDYYLKRLTIWLTIVIEKVIKHDEDKNFLGLYSQKRHETIITQLVTISKMVKVKLDKK